MISNSDRNLLIQIMLFYSVLSFFVGPSIGFYFKRDKDGISNGMMIGIILSILLWMNYGYDMIKLN